MTCSPAAARWCRTSPGRTWTSAPGRSPRSSRGLDHVLGNALDERAPGLRRGSGRKPTNGSSALPRPPGLALAGAGRQRPQLEPVDPHQPDSRGAVPGGRPPRSGANSCPLHRGPGPLPRRPSPPTGPSTRASRTGGTGQAGRWRASRCWRKPPAGRSTPTFPWSASSSPFRTGCTWAETGSSTSPTVRPGRPARCRGTCCTAGRCAWVTVRPPVTPRRSSPASRRRRRGWAGSCTRSCARSEPGGSDRARWQARRWFRSPTSRRCRSWWRAKPPAPPQGLLLAAKGGHNGEHHNHRDVGSVVVAVDGVPLLVDAGQPTYTAKTFGPDRYEIRAMQSAWHSVPAPFGLEQGTGKEFAADVLQAPIPTTQRSSWPSEQPTDCARSSGSGRPRWTGKPGRWSSPTAGTFRRRRTTERPTSTSPTSRPAPSASAERAQPPSCRTASRQLTYRSPGTAGESACAGSRPPPSSSWTNGCWMIRCCPTCGAHG